MGQIICDKCKKEKEEALNIFEYRFCKECRDDLNVITIHWVMEMCEFKAPKRKKPAETKPVIVDWNKACALKLAGWSNKEIADELGASLVTISGGISHKLKMYTHGMRFKIPKEEE